MKVATTPDIKVSVAEVCEVRGAGLEAHELLSLAAAAAENLPPCPKGTVFDTENCFISSRGTVEIKTVPQSKVDPCFVPPEWSKGDDDPGAAAVFCMGAVLRAAGAEQAADVDLFSLVNILTVAMVGTRPTAHRMGLMAKNQLRGRDAKVCLITIYEEIMGDEETNQLEDGDYSMDDEDDDIGALLGNPTNRRLINGNLPTVTVTNVSNTSQSSIKKAVDYFDEDEEMDSRAHSASTSSGQSIQKDQSPFFADTYSDSAKDLPRSTSPPSVTPATDIATDIPTGRTTRLDETYIEEHSIDLDVSFDKQLESSYVEETKPIPNYRKNSEVKQIKEVEKILTPFDDDTGHFDGSLSGKNSFMDVESSSSTSEKREKARKSLSSVKSIMDTSEEFDPDIPKQEKRLTHQPLLHKFSSSDEDIVQARIDDDEDEIPVAPRRRSYFDEIEPTPSHSKDVPVPELFEDDGASEREDLDRTHVDAVVITKNHPLPPKTLETTEDETPIEAAFEDAIRDRRRCSVPPIADGILTPPTPPPASKSSAAKKMTLLRVEQADVQVELLNGQRVEVSCRSDAVARDIFSLVVQHMNINEHVFFGLSFLKDGEHFFLEDHQRLEKFAPPGWKSAHKNGIRTQFVLYLRFRFYPQVLDFIKTDITMHELYLQVRRDVIEERIQPRRDAAYELAALALQAEFGNRPPPVIHDYFDNQHYLPQRYCSSDDPKHLQSVLAEMHGHYAGTKSSDAEHKFIQICQRHRDFGAHLHRVFRNKPTGNHGAAPFDPDTGAALWIAIMPRGIAVYEEQGSVRELLAEHLWQNTQTLQFDRKKFVIIAVEGSQQTESIFYTDHHTKSAYFVKFSASQHRFMMRMRQWKSTLKHESTIQAMPDVCVEGRDPPCPAPQSVDESVEEETSPLEAAEKMFAKMPPAAPAAAPSTPTPARPHSLDITSRDRISTERNNNQDSANNSMIENFETVNSNDSPDGEFPGMRFEVTLVKDPSNGLGLTLVDGNLNGVKGVYVKSVAENGAGMRAGLCVGDRLVGVDGMSLEGGDRHRAVDLVRQSGDSVRMEIARLDGVKILPFSKHVYISHIVIVHSGDAAKKLNTTGSSGVLTVTSQKGVSRTPPAPRRAANRRQRAVSDFGAIGDTLPALDSDNVINIKAISGLHLDESDEEQGEYRLPTTSMYSFENHYDDDSPSSPSAKTVDTVSSTELSRHSVPAAEGRRKYRYTRKSNLEWTDELEDVGEENETDEDIINVDLERNANGSLGVQIASVNGRVCIKQLTAEPASSHPDIHVGDTLVYVNGEPVANKSHQEVVSMLRSGGDMVTLGLRREPQKKGNIITAVLEKKPEGSLGLSLAKRTGSDGIFIRMIAANSAAAVEGSLRVGDRLLSLDGESVTDLTPTAILERLRAIQGAVHVTVSRDPQ
ncbi:PDZ/DHR/GLGF domain protein [Oesophagostomum dentatum]|uniref:PDZ/DHR/GLGF domain protein n=1 Tax=Oesophagostomum dentatum TaxID=61180 RepID=A0A0B1TKJ1_OESDE|nr:PDZ/DHR/GLGF domain protein [Oesophagostomum dentatum]